MYLQLASFPERTTVIAGFLPIKKSFCLDMIANFDAQIYPYQRKLVTNCDFQAKKRQNLRYVQFPPAS
jgi:hypothetical protein